MHLTHVVSVDADRVNPPRVQPPSVATLTSCFIADSTGGTVVHLPDNPLPQGVAGGAAYDDLLIVDVSGASIEFAPWSERRAAPPRWVGCRVVGETSICLIDSGLDGEGAAILLRSDGLTHVDIYRGWVPWRPA